MDRAHRRLTPVMIVEVVRAKGGSDVVRSSKRGDTAVVTQGIGLMYLYAWRVVNF